ERIRNLRDGALEDVAGDEGGELGVEALEEGHAVGEDVSAVVDGLPGRLLRHEPPVVMEDQRRAVIDEPRLGLPDEDVRIAVRAIRVHRETVQPEHAGHELVVEALELLGAWLPSAVEEAKAEVQARAALEQIGQLV